MSLYLNDGENCLKYEISLCKNILKISIVFFLYKFLTLNLWNIMILNYDMQHSIFLYKINLINVISPWWIFLGE